MKNRISLIVLVTLVIVLLAFIAYVATNPPRSGSPAGISLNNPNTPVPTTVVTAPTPYLILPTGVQTYNVQNNPYPNDATISKIVADPIEGPLNTSQTISVDVKAPATVTGVSFELTTDTKTNTYQFKLVGGTNKEGTWSGTWTMVDSHRQTYYGKFIIKDETGHVTSVDFPIR